MKFRKAKEFEINIVMEMCEEIKKTYPLWDSEYPIIENFIESYEEGGLYVLEVDGIIVGSICLEAGISDSECLSLSRFMVKPSERKKGYGRLIFESIEKEVLKRGYKMIDFLVHIDHPFAFKMYESFGYTDKGIFETPWDEGIPHYHLLIKELK